MLGRMRDLAVQAANSGCERQRRHVRPPRPRSRPAPATEIDRVATSTKFGGTSTCSRVRTVRRHRPPRRLTFATSTPLTVATDDHCLGDRLHGQHQRLTGAVTFVVRGPCRKTTTRSQMAPSLVQNKVRGDMYDAGEQRSTPTSFTVTSEVESGPVSQLSISVSVSGRHRDITCWFVRRPIRRLADLGIDRRPTSWPTAASGSGGVFQVGADANETLTRRDR